jgi:hypothetical protein
MKRGVFELIDDQAADYDFYKYNNYFKYDVHNLISIETIFTSDQIILVLFKDNRAY